ncbi:UDP-glycosyltransferase UGT4 isoform X2 [Lepeophtheirus salmonis]
MGLIIHPSTHYDTMTTNPYVIVCTTLMLLWSPGIESKKLMFYYPMMSKSVLMTFVPLAKEMRNRGHEVTIVSPYVLGLSNISEISCDKDELFPKVSEKASKTILKGESIFQVYKIMMPVLETIIKESLTNDKMSQLLMDPTSEFDAVISDTSYINIAGVYLAHHFNASLVLYFTKMMSLPDMDDAMLQPHNPSYMPLPTLQYGTNLNFSERVINVLFHWLYYLLNNWMGIHMIEDILDEVLPNKNPQNRPRITELIKSPSLSLSLGHTLILDGNRPTVPNFVQIGMLNCHPLDYTQTMESKWRNIMDNAKNGVIFISFGTFLKSSEMLIEDRDIFINVISGLKETVIWKWDSEYLEEAPSNLHVSKWLPQKEILSHPNLRLFITHGGQASYQEILCFQKPALFMPIRSDQFTNSNDGFRKGIGLVLPYKELSQESFSSALKTMLSDSIYKRNVEYWGSLIMDEKEHPMERAIWWLEYVMRHKPNKHLESPASHLNYFQIRLMDVYGFLGLCLSIGIYVSYKILRVCCGFILYCSRKLRMRDSSKRKVD